MRRAFYFPQRLALVAAIFSVCGTVAADELPWRTNQPIVTVKREQYLAQTHPEYPLFVKIYSAGPGQQRWEVAADESSGADIWENIRGRVSDDNGRTWSDYTTLPDNIVVYKGVNVWE